MLSKMVSLGFFFCFLMTLAAGCSHVPMDFGYRGPKYRPLKISTEYAYKKFSGVYEEKVTAKEKEYTIRRIKFSSSHDVLPVKHELLIDYYDVGKDGKTPVVVVLPILGGSNDFAKFFSKYFAKKGYASVIVHRQEKYKEIEDIGKIDLVFRQIVFDHKQALDWIETRTELDAGKIGVFGISMGAIKGALVSELDDRVKASVLALVGGDIPYILTYSKEKGVAERRNAFLAENNLSQEELYKYLQEKIKCDPISYAEYLDAGNVLMILATLDKSVPYEAGKRLREKMGRPETIYLLGTHRTSIIYIFYVRSQALKFFNKKLRQ